MHSLNSTWVTDFLGGLGPTFELKNVSDLLTHLQFPGRVARKFGNEEESVVLLDDGLIDLN